MKIKSLISIRFNDLTIQSFLTRNSLLRISRINSTRIVVSLYISWLYSLRARLTLSYHTIVYQSHNFNIIDEKFFLWFYLKIHRNFLYFQTRVKCDIHSFQRLARFLLLSLVLIENIFYGYFMYYINVDLTF